MDAWLSWLNPRKLHKFAYSYEVSVLIVTWDPYWWYAWPPHYISQHEDQGNGMEMDSLRMTRMVAVKSWWTICYCTGGGTKRICSFRCAGISTQSDFTERPRAYVFIGLVERCIFLYLQISCGQPQNSWGTRRWWARAHARATSTALPLSCRRSSLVLLPSAWWTCLQKVWRHFTCIVV